MNDAQSLFSVLRQTADAKVVNAIQDLVKSGADHELNRINLIEFAAKTGLGEEPVISTFLHASRLGIFDLTWNVLCPGCSGVLGAHDTLKQLSPEDYHCGLCAAGYEVSVDEQVEVAFTVSPRVRASRLTIRTRFPFGITGGRSSGVQGSTSRKRHSGASLRRRRSRRLSSRQAKRPWCRSSCQRNSSSCLSPSPIRRCFSTSRAIRHGKSRRCR